MSATRVIVHGDFKWKRAPQSTATGRSSWSINDKYRDWLLYYKGTKVGLIYNPLLIVNNYQDSSSGWKTKFFTKPDFRDLVLNKQFDDENVAMAFAEKAYLDILLTAQYPQMKAKLI